MPTRKQRRRQAKVKRHEYEFVYVDSEGHELEEPPKLARHKRHDIDVVVDRFTLAADSQGRLTESL